MDRLIAKAAIHDVLRRLAYAEDELDRSAFLDLFIPNQTFAFDVSNHIHSIPPKETTPEELYGSAYQHLAGFTATQHMLGNMLINFEDEGLIKAHAKCQVRAYHCLERESRIDSVTAHGLWLVDVELWDGKWMCRRIVIKRDVPLDHPELYEEAKTRCRRVRVDRRNRTHGVIAVMLKY